MGLGDQSHPGCAPVAGRAWCSGKRAVCNSEPGRGGRGQRCVLVLGGFFFVFPSPVDANYNSTIRTLDRWEDVSHDRQVLVTLSTAVLFSLGSRCVPLGAWIGTIICISTHEFSARTKYYCAIRHESRLKIVSRYWKRTWVHGENVKTAVARY